MTEKAFFNCPHGIPVNLICGACNAEAARANTVSPTDVTAVLTERGSRYGSFVGHADITQKIKHVCTRGDSWHKLSPDQKEALDMIAHKIGRIVNGDPNYADSWIDIAGYAKLVADRLEGTVR